MTDFPFVSTYPKYTEITVLPSNERQLFIPKLPFGLPVSV